MIISCWFLENSISCSWDILLTWRFDSNQVKANLLNNLKYYEVIFSDSEELLSYIIQTVPVIIFSHFRPLLHSHNLFPSDSRNPLSFVRTFHNTTRVDPDTSWASARHLNLDSFLWRSTLVLIVTLAFFGEHLIEAAPGVVFSLVCLFYFIFFKLTQRLREGRSEYTKRHDLECFHDSSDWERRAVGSPASGKRNYTLHEYISCSVKQV